MKSHRKFELYTKISKGLQKKNNLYFLHKLGIKNESNIQFLNY